MTAGVDEVCTQGKYWAAAEVACDLAGAEYGAVLHAGVSNDGGLSRGAAIEQRVDEMYLQMDGTAYVELASSTNARVLTEVTAQLSIGMWVYPSCEQSGSAYAFVFSREGSITTSMSYNPASGGFSAKKETLDVAVAPFAAACDMWHFIMMVAQATGFVNGDGRATTAASFYVDGVAEGFAAAPDVPPARDDALFAGGYPSDSIMWMGMIDELRIYSAALTAPQVTSLMFQETVNFLTGALTPSLVGYYRFNEGNGAVVRDKGTGAVNRAEIINNPGTPTGHTWVAGPTPLVPTTTTAVSANLSSTAGGTTVTVTGSSFVNSPWLKCVFGDPMHGPLVQTAAYQTTNGCSVFRTRPDGKISTITVQAAMSIAGGLESPATFVSSTSVTCLVPKAAAPVLLSVAVVNKPSGAVHSSVSSVPFEYKERSLSLDGAGAYVNASAVLAGVEPGGTQTYTVSLWVKPESDHAAGPGAVWAFEAAESNLAMLMFHNQRFFYYDDNILDAAGAGRGAEAGMWHFVSVTMTATGRGKLYVDSQPPVSFATASRPAPDESFTLGMDMSEDGPAAFFHGQMDEVRVFAGALSEAELASVQFAEGVGSASAEALVAYFQFNTDDASGPALGAGAALVLSAGPWNKPNVVEVTPEGGRLRYPEGVHIRGGNFAPSPYFTCAMGDQKVDCKLVEDNLLSVEMPAFAPEDASTVVTVSNNGDVDPTSLTADSENVGLFPQAATKDDLMDHLFMFKPLIGGSATGRAGTPRQAMPFGNGAVAVVLSEHELAEVTAVLENFTVVAWVKVDYDLANVQTSAREFGELQAGSWKLVALTSDTNGNGILYTNGIPETNPVKQAVYTQMIEELILTGKLSAMVGVLDDVWVYSRILTPSEMVRIHLAVDYVLDFTQEGRATINKPVGMESDADFAVSMWVMLEDISGWQTLVSMPGPVAGVPLFALSSIDAVLDVALLQACGMEPCTDYVEVLTQRPQLQAHVWQHLTFHVSNTTASVSVTVDGLLVPTVNKGFPIGGLAPFGPTLVLGEVIPVPGEPSAFNGMGGTNRRLRGMIYNVLVYAGATPAIIGFASCTMVGDDIAAYFPLNEGYAENVYDLVEGDVAGSVETSMWAITELKQTLVYLQDDGNHTVPSGVIGGCLTFSRMSQMHKQQTAGGATASDIVVTKDGAQAPVNVDVVTTNDGSFAVCFASSVCSVYNMSVLGGLWVGEVEVIAGPMDPASSTIEPAEEYCESTVAVITIALRDSQGCVATQAVGSVVVAHITGPHAMTIVAEDKVGEPGMFVVTYVPEAEGSYYVEVMVDGELVSGAAFAVEVCAGFSVYVDGYSAVELYEEDVDGLDLTGTGFTLEAWIKRARGRRPCSPRTPTPAP